MELFNLSTDLCMLVDWSMDIAVEMIIDSSTATDAIQQSTGSSSTQNLLQIAHAPLPAEPTFCSSV